MQMHLSNNRCKETRKVTSNPYTTMKIKKNYKSLTHCNFNTFYPQHHPKVSSNPIVLGA
jgi:hypothetical protein